MSPGLEKWKKLRDFQNKNAELSIENQELKKDYKKERDARILLEGEVEQLKQRIITLTEV